MAAIRVPRGYLQEERKKRESPGFQPRGPLRRGPERSANDPQRKPRGGLCGGPERSAKEPQTPFPKTSQHKANGGKGEGMDKTQKGPKPIIITMDEKGKERKWGPLSRTTAWRAGSFLEDMEGKVKVFIQKGETKSEVTVEERIQCGRKLFWLVEKPAPQPQDRQAEGNDQTPEQASRMQVVDPEETRTNHAMWLEQKIVSLEKEKEEMKIALQEMAIRIGLQENMLKQYVELQGVLDSGMTRICESVQRLNTFTESATPIINGLVQEVQKHQDNFREVGRILLNHEEHIAKTRTASEQMAQYINALIQESEKNHRWIGNLINENQEQNQLLRRHEVGLQVQAEVIKVVANQQQHPPQAQTVRGSGPTVTVVDEEGDRLDFTGGQSPQTGPPDNGPRSITTKRPRAPRPEEGRNDN